MTTPILLDGKALAAEQLLTITADALAFSHKAGRPPCLAVILVGDDPASHVYVAHKVRACNAAGIRSIKHELSTQTSEEILLQLIHQLNDDPAIDGILVQLPLPPHMNVNTVITCINPAKDVDGFHPYNLGLLAIGRPHFRPCTPMGIMQLLDQYDITLESKEVLIIGTSTIVGRPMMLECLMANATVTVCHRYTQDLGMHLQCADVIISATGQRNLVCGKDVKDGAVIIDVGMSRRPDGTLCGDVDFDSAKEKASYITPVPGGVGPMTVSCLLQNTILAAKNLG